MLCLSFYKGKEFEYMFQYLGFIISNKKLVMGKQILGYLEEFM